MYLIIPSKQLNTGNIQATSLASRDPLIGNVLIRYEVSSLKIISLVCKATHKLSIISLIYLYQIRWECYLTASLTPPEIDASILFHLRI